MKEIVIAAAIRTAIGNFNGGLAAMPAVELGAAVIREALRRAGATFEDETAADRQEDLITKADLFELGLTGTPDSASRRRALLRQLVLQERPRQSVWQ